MDIIYRLEPASKPDCNKDAPENMTGMTDVSRKPFHHGKVSVFERGWRDTTDANNKRHEVEVSLRRERPLIQSLLTRITDGSRCCSTTATVPGRHEATSRFNNLIRQVASSRHFDLIGPGRNDFYAGAAKDSASTQATSCKK